MFRHTQSHLEVSGSGEEQLDLRHVYLLQP